jgi:hypothetical protein
MSNDSDSETTSDSVEKSMPPRVPIFTDETADEKRLSMIIEESSRRGVEAGAQRLRDIEAEKQAAQAAEREPVSHEVTEPVVVHEEKEPTLPLYSYNFGFMHLVHQRSSKAIIALFVIVFGGIAMLWAFTALGNIVLELLKMGGPIDLVSFTLPFIWIPIVLFIVIAGRILLAERYTNLRTTKEGFLEYEKPTIVPLLIFGATYRVKISQIGTIDDKPEHIAFIVFKTKCVTIDTPSEESRHFKDMRGVKEYPLLRKALGQ